MTTPDPAKPAHPAFGVAELEDLERRMQGILDPDDAIEAAFTALGWLAAALSSAGLAVVPAEEQWAVRWDNADLYLEAEPTLTLCKDEADARRLYALWRQEPMASNGPYTLLRRRRGVEAGPWLPAGTEKA